MRCAAAALCAVLILPTVWFGRHTLATFHLLRSAYEAGAPDTSSIRPWMTLTYVADAYHVSVPGLLGILALPPVTNPDTNLRSAAQQSGVSPLQYVERVQRAVASLGSNEAANAAGVSSGWLAELNDQMLSALLIYGYPILALILLVGSIGLPLPDGAATGTAGSLVAQGHMSWMAAAATVVIASVTGDIVAYAVGYLIDREFLERHGHWIGYTRLRGARAQWLFAQWGLVTLFITRTFVSYLSSVASLFAGVSRYSLSKFVAVATVGRMIWAMLYLGLGYAIGADLDAATGFLSNLAGFLLCAMAVVVTALVAIMASGPR